MRHSDTEQTTDGRLRGVDTHAHLNMSPLKEDIEGAVARAGKAGLDFMGNVFLSPRQYRRDSPAFERLPQVFFILGIHPHGADAEDEGSIAELRDTLQSDSRIRALGEIGLDFNRERSSRQGQRERFRQQLELARELDRPVVIHSRDAEEETMDTLLELGFRDRPLLWHCFGLDAEFASRVLACGWTISVPGMLTFKKADALRRAVSTIPLDRLVLETDCPFLAPEPYRGKTNEPSLLPLIAREAARLHGLETEAVLRATGETARRFFRLDG
ncbi:MAG: TatD family hydrolase [Desulfohalobiaceae bacterium]|nr:TatD family hydrolase [Desulfohalobiaceae bacterium]